MLDILGQFKDYFDSTEMLADIDWTMKMIASNKLYEPVLNEASEKNELVSIEIPNISLD